MAFESLTSRLSKAFKNVIGKGKLSEKNMNDMLRVFMEDGLSEFFYYQKDNKWIYDLK